MTEQINSEKHLVAPDQTAQTVLQLVSQLALEMHHGKRRLKAVHLDSMLDRDLELDSLSRVELLQRIEHHFKVRLSEQLLASAETPRDLLEGVIRASGQKSSPIISESDLILSGITDSNPVNAETLIDVLQWHVNKHPERPHIFLYGDSDEPQIIRYQDLLEGAQELASGLQYHGLKPAQTVAIMLPTGRDYLFTYFAILLTGAIPVPIYPPTRASQLEEHLRRHAKILNNAETVLLITVSEAKIPGQLLKAQVESLLHVLVVDELRQHAGQTLQVPIKREDIAFIQYTSGSTGTPKGVVLTHQHLLANIRAMGDVVEASSDDVFVSWLPLYHDMGLIGAWLGSLYFASPLVLMSPLTFLTRPARWLWAIDKHKGTLSAAPNFAYEFCLNKIKDEDIADLNLSSWRMAFNGAEPVNPKTLTDFAQHFASYGFKAEAIAPVYGLAESAVGLAFPPPGRGALIDTVERDALQISGIAKPIQQKKPVPSVEYAACGHPLPGYQIRIVDPAGRELPERREGRLQFQGPSATSGYYHNPEQSQQLFDDGWLETGDLAYIAAGDLYLTGRSKELIIRAGRNIYPYEIEQAVGAIPGVRKGCVAVFGSIEQETGTERIVVLAETRETDETILESLRKSIDKVTSDILLGSSPDEILLLPPHTVLKTSSGKIRRTACRDLYEKQALEKHSYSIPLQLIRVAASSLFPQLRKIIHRTQENLFAVWAWGCFALLAPLTWLIVAILPSIKLRWAYIRGTANLFRLLTGTSLKLNGLENINTTTPSVLICNHASYLDGMILMAALPKKFQFIAKKELKSQTISRIFLERIGCLFVERFDIKHGASDARQLQKAVQSGNSLMIFPEGTFTRISGLRSFRMGAFSAAAQSNVPVIPIILSGSRNILGAATWFPRKGNLSITICSPIYPKDSSWQAATRLRDEARAEMLKHLNEPDLTQH